MLMIVAGFVLFGSTQSHANTTVNVTMNGYAAFTAQNPGPGMLCIMGSDSPNAGNEYDSGLAWITVSGNMTNSPTVFNESAYNCAGKNCRYYTAVFNNNNASQATGCTTSPINFFTSTSSIPSGAAFQ